MTHQYDLQSLIDTFAKHSHEYENYQKNLLNKFTMDSPNEKMPDHMKDNFNISQAFYMMCLEIMRLKTIIDYQTENLKHLNNRGEF